MSKYNLLNLTLVAVSAIGLAGCENLPAAKELRAPLLAARVVRPWGPRSVATNIAL